MKDDRTSSVMQDDDSSPTEDERDDLQEAQQRDQRSPRSHRKSPSPQTGSSGSDEEEQERYPSRKREKTRGYMQVETDTGQTVYMQVEPTDAQVHPGQTAYIQVEPDTGQTAYTSRRKKTGSAMQVEPDMGQTVHMQVEPTDVQVHPGQTAYAQVEPDTGQTAFTSGRQKTGSTMQIESRDPRSYPIQTSYIPTGSNVQVEPTDVQVHLGQTAHLLTRSDMQIESMDPRSRPNQTACTPPDAVVQQKTDNGRQEQRQRSPPDTAARMTVDTGARPISGCAATLQEEDKITVEEELSSLQLIPEVDSQSPAITKRQQVCRIVTQAVIEPEPSGKSSAMEISDPEQTTANKPEVAEPHQQLTVSEKTELEELRRANAAMNQRLTSGFYLMPYFESGRPLTPGVAAGPDVQMYARPADVYGAYHNGPSFYNPPGYTQCVYLNGVQYTPLMEIQRFSRPDKALYAYPHGVSYPSQEVEIRQVDKVLSDQQQSTDFSRQPEMDERTATTRPVVQFSDTTPENMVIRLDSGHQQDATATDQVRTPETGSTELETVDTVYHTARRDNPSCREEPAVESIQKTKERKALQYDSEESDDDDVAEQRHPKGKVETDAKAGTTRHSSHQSNGMSK